MKANQTKYWWVSICISLDSSTLLTCIQFWTNEVTLQLETLQLKCFHVPAYKKPNPLLFKPYCSTELQIPSAPPQHFQKGKKKNRFTPLSLHRLNLLQQNPKRWWFSNASYSGQCLFSLFRKWEVFFLSLSSFPSARTQQEPEHI